MQAVAEMDHMPENAEITVGTLLLEMKNLMGH
jgi:hypothetical protein